jgi:hypothetical protein
VSETVLDALVESIRRAARFNQGDKAPPVAVLWPDPGAVWRPLVQGLRRRLRVITLGDHDADQGSGPAIWLRCVMAGEVAERPPQDEPWIVWLPGVTRDALRAVDHAPPPLRPLCELQYRSEWWTQKDRSAWTPASWLGSQAGLGLDLARDQATRGALDLSLTELFQVPVEGLRRRGRIDADYLMGLVSRDEVRTLLRWLNDPEGTQAALPAQEWQVFLAQCRKELNVDLLREGPISVAERLGGVDAPWDVVWDRYAEAPASYPNIPDLLRRAKTQLVVDPLHWPQDNDDAELDLQRELTKVGSLQPSQARLRVEQLEAEHGVRRTTVWAALGEAPLAEALVPLADLAERTERLPHAVTADEIVTWYMDEGHLADAAVAAALALVRVPARDAVGLAVRTLYYSWLDECNRRFQLAVGATGYEATVGLQLKDGDCAVFVDGLRYDVGTALRNVLRGRGVEVSLEHRFATMPSVTSTGKAALMPFARDLAAGDEFTVRLDNKALSVKEALLSRGVAVLGPGDVHRVTEQGWTEAADIDKTGHNLGLAVAERLAGQVNDIAARIQDLLSAGWDRVVVATDHGWLLMPGGLAKQELAEHLTLVRKSRAARLKPGAADGGYPVVPHAYDASIRIATPHGIAAFEAGKLYDHGGLTLQECVIPHLVATSGTVTSPAARIDALSWAGLRCRVAVVGAPAGSAVDLRLMPGDAGSSIVTKTKPVEGSDEAAVLVPDDAIKGKDAYVVLLSDTGDILSQMTTRVGG